MSNEAFIINQLSGLPSKKDSKSIWVCCPFHNEKTPSCRINLQDGKYPAGTFYCFGCQESGIWNKLADKLGVQKFGKSEYSVNYSDNYSEEVRKSLIGSKKRKKAKEKTKVVSLDTIKHWRNIDTRLLKKIGAKLDVTNQVNFVILPVIVNGEKLCEIKARMRKPKNNMPSYANEEDTETKTYGLFPYHYTEKLLKTGKTWRNKKVKYRYICLTEGPRDSLRLIQEGIPAISILGTHSWNIEKLRLLKILCVLYDVGICVIMDGDSAGVKAQKTIVDMLKAHKIDFKQVKLTKWAKVYGYEKLDPMDAPEELVDLIRDLCCG